MTAPTYSPINSAQGVSSTSSPCVVCSQLNFGSPVLWPPHAKSWLIGKDSDAERDWGQEEKRTTEDEMAGWHHWVDGRESEWTLGVGDGQGGLACCDSWVPKSRTRLSDWTDWWLNDLKQRKWIPHFLLTNVSYYCYNYVTLLTLLILLFLLFYERGQQLGFTNISFM